MTEMTDSHERDHQIMEWLSTIYSSQPELWGRGWFWQAENGRLAVHVRYGCDEYGHQLSRRVGVVRMTFWE